MIYHFRLRIKIFLLLSIMLLIGSNLNSKRLQENGTTNTTTVTKGSQKLPALFSTFEINKKYYNKSGGYVDLILKLPKLIGNNRGIPRINSFFAAKEKFFLNEIQLTDSHENNFKLYGKSDNYYRSADYKLEVFFNDVISMSASLDGGQGGATAWDGIEGDVFNLNTGEKLKISDLFKVPQKEYMNLIYSFVIKSIQNKKDDFYDLDPSNGEGLAAIKSWKTDNFYLTKNTLVIFYDKYVLACGAAGAIKFEIPLKQIKNILKIDTQNHL